MAEIRHEERYGPYMTANNSPAPFVATASQNSWGAFRAFSESMDDDITFTGLAAGTEQWIQIQLDAPIRIWAFSIACRTTVSAKDSGQVPKNFTVQGSEDGAIFEDIQTYANTEWGLFASWDTANNKYDWGNAKKIEIACEKEYQYFRFLFGQCQSISTQKLGPMTPLESNTVKPTKIDLFQIEGYPDPPSGLEGYLNTIEGMEILVNNIKKDDDTIVIPGADWFQFNGRTASNLCVSGNSWIGIGESTEQIKVCRRDGAMYYLYRQEGLLYNYYKFLKVRWEGYTQYNQTSAANALKYEFLIFDTGDMFLNVIQTPTNSSYIGTSSITCNGATTTLEIPISSTPMITFTHQDKMGFSWKVSYGKIVIDPPFDMRYLFSDADSKRYTITAGALSEVPISTLTAQAFLDLGVDAKASVNWMLLSGLRNPRILYWQDSQHKPRDIQAAVTAFPIPQELTVTADMTHKSISGIRLMSANYSGQIGVWYSTGGGTYTDEVSMDDFLAMDVTELWESVQPGRKLHLVFLLHGDATLTTFQISYNNYGG